MVTSMKKIDYSIVETLTTSTDKMFNLDKLGINEFHNILLITGIPGSGKSTLAEDISKKIPSDVIHLDNYFETPDKPGRNKSFDRYLKKSLPEFTKVTKNWESVYRSARDTFSTDYNFYWDTMDRFRDEIFDFSFKQYGKRLVIVEGVQIGEQEFDPSRESRISRMRFYPTIIRIPDPVVSVNRMNSRDSNSPEAEEFKQQIIWMESYADDFRKLTDEIEWKK